MKTKIIKMLCASFLLSIMFACKKEELIVGSEDIFKYISVVKTSEDYSNYVSVSSRNGRVIGYPGPDGGEPRLIPLVDGYYMIDCRTTFKATYTNITFSEYKDVWKEHKGDIRDTLSSRILTTDPYIEGYEVERRYFMVPMDDRHDGLNIELIRDMIKSGEFFTHESVKRIK